MCFAKLKTKFREFIYYCQVNEVICPNERIFSSYALFIGYFLFHKLDQSTNICNDDGNDNRVGRNRCSDRDESFSHDIIDDIKN